MERCNDRRGNHNGHKEYTMCTKKSYSDLCDNIVFFVVNNKRDTNALNDVHLAQILTYMRLGNYKLGLLINFNLVLLKQGIRRVINGTL